MLSSCFDCVHLRDGPDPALRNWVFLCPIYRRVMEYNVARTPNNCPKKQQHHENVVQFPVNPILDNLYQRCLELAYYIERPFTVRELAEEVNYHNKNSLWMLMEQLVQQGKLEKVDANTTNYRGQRYRAKVYWPVRSTDTFSSIQLQQRDA